MQGRVVAGRFEIERQAGSGGMGTVYRARDLLGGDSVALKLLHSDEVRDAERFAQEASILARLNHPAIVRYVAHGTENTSEGSQHYLVMEWLEGESLAARIDQQPLGLRDALVVIRRVAEALGHAHGIGVVHRDIKPENLFLPSGRIDDLKLLDFGIARLTHVNRRLTMTGMLIGTPGYLPPEIVSGAREVDGRADLFSLGCIAFRCLTGRAPFEGEELGALLAKIILETPPAVSSIAPSVPQPVSDLVAWLLKKTPEERPKDTAALLEALDDVGELPDAPAAYLKRRNAVSLTLTEVRIACVVMIGPPRAPARAEGTCGQAMTELFAPAPAPAALKTEAEAAFGASMHALLDGSFLIKLPAVGRAVDLATRAARVALLAQRHLPERAIAVALGQARTNDAASGFAGLLEMGVQLLRETPAGRVRVPPMVSALLEGRFEIAHEGEALLLERERDQQRAQRRLLGKPTEFVGRSREIASLLGMLAASVDESAAQAALVVGGAGIGKSRLLEEVLAAAERQAPKLKVLFGGGDSLSAGAPFSLIGRALRRHAGVRDGEPIEDSRRKFETTFGPRAGAKGAAATIASLGELSQIPFPDGHHEALRAARANPQLMGDLMRRAFEDWLAAECDAQPVLLVLEDLHWGDSGTVGLIDAALRHLRDSSFMVLALARPEVRDAFPELWSGRGLQTIELGPLPRKLAEKVLRDALGDALTPALQAQILARADGNPFFLEELVRAAREGRADALPDSVLGMVQARLDAEGERAKQILRAASIYGERFSRGGLCALLGGEAELPETLEWVHRLVDRELVNRGSAPEGAEGEFVFSHALVREAAYAMLTAEDRLLGHRLAGDFLERAHCPDAMVLAEHFRRGEELARSVPWYRVAAEQALRASDLPGALARAGRGLAALDGLGPDGRAGVAADAEGAMRLTEAEALLWRGELALAERSGAAASAALPAGGSLWFRAVGQTVIALAKQGKVPAIEALIARALEQEPAEEARDPQIVCLAWAASFLFQAARQEVADALFERIYRLTERVAAPDSGTLALVHQARAARAALQGAPAVCLEALEAACTAFEQAADVRNTSAVRANVGFVLAELGAWPRAEQVLREALEAAERMGLSELRAVVQHNLGRVLAHRGDLAGGEALERLALESFVAQGEPRLEGLARTYLAEIRLLAGAAAEAGAEAEAAVRVLDGAPGPRAQALGLLARARLAQGQIEPALASAQEAAGAVEALGSIDEGEAAVRLAYAECLAAARQTDEAERVLRIAKGRLLARAETIADPALRARFLTDIPAHARTLEQTGGHESVFG